MPIGPEEAFVLSRVDGKASASEIAMATGLEAPKVSAALERLAALGALILDGRSAPDGQGPDGEPQHPSSEPGGPRRAIGSSSPAPATRPRRHSAIDPRPLYAADELDPSCDLPREHQHFVLNLFCQLQLLDHYAILDVSPDADKKQLKAAYFRLVSVLHPDRYFGKNLGRFKTKLEQCFQRVTDAHDTLTRKKKREEYDRYLESRGATRALDRLQDADAVQVELTAIQKEIEAEAHRASSNPPDTGGPSVAPIPTPEEPPRRASTATLRPRAVSSVASPRPHMTQDERRQALARKLGRMARPSPYPSEAPPPLSVTERRQAAGDALRARYEGRLRDVVQNRLQRYLDQADEAERAGHHVAAANALRIAVQLSPDSTLLQERFERIEQRASEFLAEKYLEQARYEERSGYWLKAAANYEKAARGRPTAPIYEKAAQCHLNGSGDLRRAGELARMAVDLAPKDVGYRITLATIYAKAGMEHSALAELERAKTLEPTNDSIMDLWKRIRRGEL